MWPFALVAAGLGLSASLIAIAEVVSSLKYPCTDTSDDMVTAALIIDIVRVVCGVVVCAVVSWTYTKSRYPVPNDSDKDKYISTVQTYSSALVVLVTACLTLDSIQRSEACVNCIREKDESAAVFEANVKRMVGDANCAGYFTPAYFKIPENYCRRELETRCAVLSADATVYSERCLVYACSPLTHGYNFRYLCGVFGMIVQAFVCMLLMTQPFWHPSVQRAALAAASAPPLAQTIGYEASALDTDKEYFRARTGLGLRSRKRTQSLNEPIKF